MSIINPKDHFNSDYYMEVNKARDQIFQEILPNLVDQLKLTTAIDVGCGIGYYTNYLANVGLKVVGVDGRQENIEIARSTFPNLRFITANIESQLPERSEKYDLVFCVGLLYHLENPFRAIRNLKELCKTVCLIESRVHWANSPIALFVKDSEGPSQALDHYAMILTRRCMINMLYAAGFENVYSIEYKSSHDELSGNILRSPRRHFFIASYSPISMAELILEPKSSNKDMSNSLCYEKSFRRFYKSILEYFRWLFFS